ncbi:hypothetical protein [Spartinivicinus poritis]|uniref:Uncharacterized protein n=1 Tax=Spartinivicinus poritis TaxID=2994640 RepID=A0ABT5U8H3_9GAMM|nr:hypothetical protein [Spartinivicinus sp. A2-2]MDE1462679.1 hypothetical protein [Spartinivicinus sp. A2-2]
MSFFRLTQQESTWHLTAILAQATVQSYLPSTNKPPLKVKPAKQLQEKQLVDYLQNNIAFTMNGQLIPLKLNNVKLGHHETKVSFKLNTAPKQLESMDIVIKAFAHGKNHHNILLISSANTKQKVILSSKNNYSSKLQFIPPKNTVK